MPFKIGTVSFFYNKALFAKAGVDADSHQDLGRLSRRGEEDQGCRHRADRRRRRREVADPFLLELSRHARRRPDRSSTAAKNGQGDGFNDPAIIKAGEQLAELGKLEPFQPGYLGATWPQALGVFGDGKAAMILGFENTDANQRTNAGDGKGLADDNIGRFAFPAVDRRRGARRPIRSAA